MANKAARLLKKSGSYPRFINENSDWLNEEFDSSELPQAVLNYEPATFPANVVNDQDPCAVPNLASPIEDYEPICDPGNIEICSTPTLTRGVKRKRALKPYKNVSKQIKGIIFYHFAIVS